MILPLALALGLAQTPRADGSLIGAGAARDTVEAATDTIERAPPIGREAVEALTYPPLVFDPPHVEDHEELGVPVLFLRDSTLPLVDVQLLIRGGVTHFPREDFGAVSALPILLRTGGTTELSADSVDRAIDLLGLQLSIGSGGAGTTVSLNTLSDRLAPTLDLLRRMLLEPRFSPDALDVWRNQELERVRRREDNPGSLAFSEYNRLMYGDHPVGWVMEEADLSPDRVSLDRLRSLHAMLLCRERLIAGVSGDIAWEEVEPAMRSFLRAWPPCPARLPAPPEVEVRREPGVFVLPKNVDQSTIIVAQSVDVHQGDSPEYFASRIADFVLGSGGFSSRITSRVRTEEGLAYGATSVWTTPIQYDGLLGALTATSGETTMEATRLLLDILKDFRANPPSAAEVAEASEKITAGYVFAFESPAEIVARQIAYRAQGLPESWLSRYLEGLQEVTDSAVAGVVRSNLDPERMTILIVGDPTRFDPGLDAFEHVYELSSDGSYRPWVSPASAPGGSPRSPR